MSFAMVLTWRQARMEDADLLWSWANDPETRRNSFNKSPIPYAQHLAWLQTRLRSATTRLWIFSDGDGPVGLVRSEDDGTGWELHIVVAPERRGRGYGRTVLAQAVELTRALAGGRPIRAKVLALNAASLTLFEGCGFRRVGETPSPAGERALILEWAVAPGPRQTDDTT